MDSTFPRCTLPANMTLIQYADNLYANWCKVADVYDNPKLKDNFVDGVDSSICHA